MTGAASFFIVLTAVLFIFAVLLARRASGNRAALVVAGAAGAWLALTALLASRGFYADFEAMPPRVALAVVPVFVTILCLAVSRRVRDAVARVPAWWIIAIHVFRLPLELVLHRLYADGVIPRQMTYEGLNFDIITGITAPVAAYIVARGGAAARAIGLAWTVLGLVLVATITTVSIMSTPTVAAFPPPFNTFVARFPFIWLPCFIVPLAWLLHLLAFDRLRRIARQ